MVPGQTKTIELTVRQLILSIYPHSDEADSDNLDEIRKATYHLVKKEKSTLRLIESVDKLLDLINRNYPSIISYQRTRQPVWDQIQRILPETQVQIMILGEVHPDDRDAGYRERSAVALAYLQNAQRLLITIKALIESGVQSSDPQLQPMYVPFPYEERMRDLTLTRQFAANIQNLIQQDIPALFEKLFRLFRR
jgi:hypothetical protein